MFKGIKKVTSPDSLKYLDGRAASMLALLKKQDIESLATSSAKRRFFRIELETSGIDPDRVTTAHVEAAKAAGCTSLATWLDSLRKLCEYAGSEARRKWNPAATASDRASQVPIASDWFLQSTYLPEWDEMDFLSRCESIWTGNGFTGEGMMFTRIFNYRVKMLTGYEDGLRLVLLLTEVGTYVPPLDLLNREPAKVEPIDLVRRSNAFDGREPNDYSMLIQVPMGKPEWAFSFSEIIPQPFEKLIGILGKEAFHQIMEKMGYAYPVTEFDTYVGDDDLMLYFYWRKDEVPGARKLILVGMGEFQPGRYIANIEGFWRVFGADN
ncbi:MAG: hypothetical protein IPN95_17195 [Bacteroidetes bacterium]|nr:hypothetical protein [Bacteroidota bacterium]